MLISLRSDAGSGDLKSDQIRSEAHLPHHHPYPKKKDPLRDSVRVWRGFLRPERRACAAGRAIGAVSLPLTHTVLSLSPSPASHAVRSALTSVHLSIGASISVTLGRAHCDDNRRDGTESLRCHTNHSPREGGDQAPAKSGCRNIHTDPGEGKGGGRPVRIRFLPTSLPPQLLPSFFCALGNGPVWFLFCFSPLPSSKGRNAQLPRGRKGGVS